MMMFKIIDFVQKRFFYFILFLLSALSSERQFRLPLALFLPLLQLVLAALSAKVTSTVYMLL